jgi:capsular exopolysaccharide synthesis family protein
VDLAEHFRVIAHNWWRILVVAALVAAAVYYLSGRRDDVYDASTQLNVTVGNSAGSQTIREETVFLTQTYAQRATTRPVLRAAVKDSGLHITTDEADSRVSASASSDLGFLTIDAESPTPQQARKLADAAARALIADVQAQQQRVEDQDLKPINDEINSLTQQLDALPAGSPERAALQARYDALLQSALERRTRPKNTVEVVASAELPTSPASPKPSRDALLAFLASLVIAGELSVVMHAFSDRLPRVLDAEDVGRLVGLPVLASVPRGSDAVVVEAFRILRTSLFALPPDQRPRSIAVVSANAGAGKSFTSINLARSAGAQQAGVLLVDADLRRPVIHERLKIDREPGLTDVLDGSSTRGAVHSVGVGVDFAVGEPRRFLAMASGHAVRDPVAALSGDALHRLVSKLDEAPNLMIVDTPPAATFGDASAIAAQCEAVILVLDARSSRLQEARSVTASLARSGAQLLGIVLNRAQQRREARYY